MGRRALLAYPRFSRNQLLNYENMTPFYPGWRAVMPPLGLLTFGAVLVKRGWEVRLVDENVRAVTDEDVCWADAVFLSGMHPQRARLSALIELARRHGKLSVVGGPSANICPEYYPQADAVHQGEIGDATCLLLDWLDETLAAPAPERPREQRVFQTNAKTPLDEQPLPALQLIEPNAYIMLPIQFSVGCPYTCEFCDIPMIYGRIARLKSPGRVLAELEQAYAAGFVGLILFVDDNLIANRKAFRKLLGEVQCWQQQRGYPFALTGEASVNIARDEELLDAMRDARFTHLFLGVESPDAAVLEEISKKQNTLEPVVDSLRTIERHGIEVILGIIFGFDGDTPKTGERMREFLREANAPLVYFNLLAALPKTPLWERLVKEGRLLETGDGDARQSESMLACLATNVRYRLDNELVVQMLLDTVAEVYSPREVYRRNLWNVEHVYGRQLGGRPPVRNLAELRFIVRFLLGTLLRVLLGIGLRAEREERREFWRFVAGVVRLRRAGRIASALEVLLRVPPNTHHLITWGRTLREDHARATERTRAARHAAASRGALVEARCGLTPRSPRESSTSAGPSTQPPGRPADRVAVLPDRPPRRMFARHLDVAQRVSSAGRERRARRRVDARKTEGKAEDPPAAVTAFRLPVGDAGRRARFDGELVEPRDGHCTRRADECDEDRGPAGHCGRPSTT